MIEESARIIEVGPDFLRVSSEPKSGCGKCAAEQGCGQGLLNRWAARTTILTVPLNGLDPKDFREDDQVLLGLPENALLRSVSLLYLTPLLLMIGGVWLGNWLFQGDLIVALLAVIGLCLGALIARFGAQAMMSQTAVTPVLIGKVTS